MTQKKEGLAAKERKGRKEDLAADPEFSLDRWGSERGDSGRRGGNDPKNSSSAERNERSESIRGLYTNANIHLPDEWRLLQNFLSFDIFRFFRPFNCRIKDDLMRGSGARARGQSGVEPKWLATAVHGRR